MFSTPQNKRNPSYLVRNPHGYNFRIIVPKDLQNIVGKCELRYSLKTGFLSEGKSRARLLAGLIQQLFFKIRSNRPEYGKQQIESLIRRFLDFVMEDSASFMTTDLMNDVSTPSLGIKLQKLIDDFIAENLRSSRWSDRTCRDYRYCLNLFLRYFGNVPLSTINYDRVGKYSVNVQAVHLTTT